MIKNIYSVYVARHVPDNYDGEEWFRGQLALGQVAFLFAGLEQVTNTSGMSVFLSCEQVTNCPVLITGHPNTLRSSSDIFAGAANSSWQTLTSYRPGHFNERLFAPIDEDAENPEEARIRRSYVNELNENIRLTLSRQIHNLPFIELGYDSAPVDLFRPINPFDLAEPTSFTGNVMQNAGKRVLILGKPGSGKTTSLLNIVREFVHEAQLDREAPIPCYLALPDFIEFLGKNNQSRFFTRMLTAITKKNSQSRSGDQQPTYADFRRWILHELGVYPGVSKFAKKWLDSNQFAICLDGLDELPADLRPLVLLFINQLTAEDPSYSIIVSSRRVEYELLVEMTRVRLRLSEVRMKDLTDDLITEYLTKANASHLKEALKADEQLRQVVRTPLDLSIFTLAYSGLWPEEIPKKSTVFQTRHQMIETYADRMIQRHERRCRGKPLDDHRSNDIATSNYRFKPEKVKTFLGWLARRNRTDFQLAAISQHTFGRKVSSRGAYDIIALPPILILLTTFLVLSLGLELAAIKAKATLPITIPLVTLLGLYAVFCGDRLSSRSKPSRSVVRGVVTFPYQLFGFLLPAGILLSGATSNFQSFFDDGVAAVCLAGYAIYGSMTFASHLAFRSSPFSREDFMFFLHPRDPVTDRKKIFEYLGKFGYITIWFASLYLAFHYMLAVAFGSLVFYFESFFLLVVPTFWPHFSKKAKRIKLSRRLLKSLKFYLATLVTALFLIIGKSAIMVIPFFGCFTWFASFVFIQFVVNQAKIFDLLSCAILCGIGYRLNGAAGFAASLVLLVHVP